MELAELSNEQRQDRHNEDGHDAEYEAPVEMLHEESGYKWSDERGNDPRGGEPREDPRLAFGNHVISDEYV